MRKVKIIAVIFSVILLIGVLSACGAAVIEKPVPAEGATTFEITGKCNISVDGSQITVTGQTSFMTGTIINVSIVAQNGMVVESVNVSQTSDGDISTVFQITSDKYDKDVKAITAYITVAPTINGKQSEGVLGEYGNKFEKISNATLWNKDGNVVMFASETYEL